MVRTLLCNVYWALMVLALSGCEILREDEVPGEMSCRAECNDCGQLIIECDGETRGMNTTNQKVSIP